MFEGFIVPAVALAALWPPLSAARMGYGVGLALAFEVSLGTNGIVYPWLREHALPFRGLRVPARMAIVVGLSLAILVGYTVARISRAGISRAARVRGDRGDRRRHRCRVPIHPRPGRRLAKATAGI